MRWQRLDVPGTDECVLEPVEAGWRLDGLARFVVGPDGARLRYTVEADTAWRTRHAVVHGTVGPRTVEIAVQRAVTGDWRIDGAPAPALRGLIDLDLGFTPATNLFPLRRLALHQGQAADAEAAWLDDTTWTIVRLPQRYERRDAGSYWYESPSSGYSGLLTVTPEGFVSEYPGLWTAAS